jgi:DNA-binding transcriptional LysR family regulator
MTFASEIYAPYPTPIRKTKPRSDNHCAANANITLEQLRVFCAVCERENMTVAAKQLGLTQSGVSGAISSLEERCGLPLFDRIGRSIRLSDAGRVFATEAREILARVGAAEQALDEFKQVKRGTLHVLASHTVGTYWLPYGLIEYRRISPRVNIVTRIQNSASVVRALLDGEAPIGFVEAIVTEPDLDQEIVAEDDLVVVVGPQHPWAKMSSFDPKDLIKGRWILREQGSGTRSAFEAALRSFGAAPEALNVALEIPLDQAIRTVVEGGLGAAALSALVVRESIAAGRLAPVAVTLPKRSFRMLSHRDRKLGSLARSFMEIARSAGNRKGA